MKHTVVTANSLTSYIDVKTISDLQYLFSKFSLLDGMDIDVSTGHYTVDGHSILGLLSLSYPQTLTVTFYSNEFTPEELSVIAEINMH